MDGYETIEEETDGVVELLRNEDGSIDALLLADAFVGRSKQDIILVLLSADSAGAKEAGGNGQIQFRLDRKTARWVAAMLERAAAIVAAEGPDVPPGVPN